MATLNGQIALIEEQLRLNQQADDARHILREYEAIREPLSKVDSSLVTIFGHYMVLQALPEDAPKRMVFSAETKEAAKKALFVLQAFTERWQEEKHKARQGDDLANATQSLESLASCCLDEVKHCWLSWVSFLESYVYLEDVLLQSQKNIPGLEETYSGFITVHSRFRELIKLLPNDSDVIYELKQLSEKMVKLKGKMQFNLPEEVSAFFKELDTLNRRVSLSLLTPKVFEWLRDNNLLGEYVVSRRGRN